MANQQCCHQWLSILPWVEIIAIHKVCDIASQEWSGIVTRDSREVSWILERDSRVVSFTLNLNCQNYMAMRDRLLLGYS